MQPGWRHDELECAILTPDNPSITTPDWYFVASTGNVSAQKIEDALMTYANSPDDQVVIIPIFDATCQDRPRTTGKDDCTTARAMGQNQYYHLAAWAGFDIEWVDLGGGSVGLRVRQRFDRLLQGPVQVLRRHALGHAERSHRRTSARSPW